MSGDNYEPVKHYGHDAYRETSTICGKEKSFVVVTFFPDQVTCDVCIEELRLQDGRVTS